MFQNPFKKEENEELKEPAQPTSQDTSEEKLFPIQISSKGIETRRRADGSGRYIVGSVNGDPFEVDCDQIVHVPEDVYNALLPMLNR